MTAISLQPLRRHAPETLLLTATLALVGFYYLLRADTIGSFSPGRGWTAITLPPVGPAWHYALSAVLLAGVPLAVARAVTGLSWSALGLGLGRWRAGLAIVALGLPLAVLAGWIAAQSPAMRAVYPLDPAITAAPGVFLPHAAREFLYYGAWEVLFRGVLLFGLRGAIGDGPSIAVQTGLSVTAHFGRALDETFSAAPAGLLFGWITLRLGAIWPIALVHWAVGVATEWWILAG